MDLRQHIESNPKIMFGKPVIKGTRIPVDIILEKLAHGHDIDSILTDYPTIKREDILACLFYASLQIRNEHIYAIAS
ncbi:MAG: DUF433 domain-containing protein [Bacteroidetes bacterium]|nr:DUF433 domain-containing protein [Bacteroidota bacterium]